VLTESVVLVVGLIGLALAGRLLLAEPDRRVRLLTAGGAVAGFAVAFAIALATGRGALVGVALGALGAAVLALALLGQWLLIARLTKPRGRT
jgi:hypothetical protein